MIVIQRAPLPLEPANAELRENSTLELREDGTAELRE